MPGTFSMHSIRADNASRTCNSQVLEVEATTELGTYGICLSDGDKVVKSEFVGHLLRSKTASSKETGVAAGQSLVARAC
eukprot:822703-Rhodomonas_salina.1